MGAPVLDLASLAPPAAGAPSPLELITRWELRPGLTAALALTAAAYLFAAGRRSGRGHWPAGRTVSFLAGVLVLAASLQSGLDARAADLLSVHMTQHLLLLLVVPPLLLLGAPVTLALRTLPPLARRRLGGAVTSRLARTATRPAVAWSLFVSVMLVTHLTGFYDAAIRSEPLHALEHALYLGAGLLFWAPVLGADPVPRPSEPALRILYLVLAMPPMALVGVALASSGDLRYPSYAAPARALGLSPIADQEAAGMIMWIGGGAALAAVAVAVAWTELRRQQLRQLARESHGERRTPVPPATAGDNT